MLYISTRSEGRGEPSATAIEQGICKDGGLFAPESFPQFSLKAITDMAAMPYAARAAAVIGAYLTDYTAQEISGLASAAYGKRFSHPGIAPVKMAGDAYALELYHGPTQAFKDMALQILPGLLTLAMRKNCGGLKSLILVATSGDTGKAALEGFKDVDGTRVVVFYPEGGVSPAQRRQMVTQRGRNLNVAAVRGNFDDAQSGVKAIFGDAEFSAQLAKKGYALSSANSINWGRLVPQIAYYFSAYADIVAEGGIAAGDKLNVCVPTGNFGNILAAYYAKRMGLPLGRLICASNRNNVLADWINTGAYDANRPFYRTASPSMDILISSNAERLVFELCQRDANAVARLMLSLRDSGRYALPDSARGALAEGFYGCWADDAMGDEQIKRAYNDHGYLMDTHTAIGFAALGQYRQSTGDTRPAMVAATASPFKFAGRVLKALTGADEGDDAKAADDLSRLCGIPVPEPLIAMRNLPEIHDSVCDKRDMAKTVTKFLAGDA